MRLMPRSVLATGRRLRSLARIGGRIRYGTGTLWVVVLAAALAAPGALPAPDPIDRAPTAEQLEEARERGREAAEEQPRAEDEEAAEEAASGPGASGSPPSSLAIPSGGDTDIPGLALRAYREAEAWVGGFDPGCHLSWTVLAGIGRLESNHGRHYGSKARFAPNGDVLPTIVGPPLNGANNTKRVPDTDSGQWDHDPVWDRAVGPMQFIPSTWRALGRDGNADNRADPNNFFDAAVSAAAYLCLSGDGDLSDPARLRRAVYSYNHSWEYVDAVLAWARLYAGDVTTVPSPLGPPDDGIFPLDPGTDRVTGGTRPRQRPDTSGGTTGGGGTQRPSGPQIPRPAPGFPNPSPNPGPGVPDPTEPPIPTTGPPGPTFPDPDTTGTSTSTSTSSTAPSTTGPGTTAPQTTAPDTTPPDGTTSTTAGCANTTTTTSSSSTTSSTTTTTTTTTTLPGATTSSTRPQCV